MCLSFLVLLDGTSALSLPPRELKYDYAYIVDQPAPSVALIENSIDPHIAPSTFPGTHPLKEDDIFMFLHIPVRISFVCSKLCCCFFCCVFRDGGAVAVVRRG